MQRVRRDVVMDEGTAAGDGVRTRGHSGIAIVFMMTCWNVVSQPRDRIDGTFNKIETQILGGLSKWTVGISAPVC